jgi:hypothetical protein
MAWTIASMSLWGEPLQATKMAALQAIGDAGLHVTIVAAQLRPESISINSAASLRLPGGVLRRPGWSSTCQPIPAGSLFPEELESRVTAPDCPRELVNQSEGLFQG